MPSAAQTADMHKVGKYWVRTHTAHGETRGWAFTDERRSGRPLCAAQGSSVTEVLRDIDIQLKARDAELRSKRVNGIPTTQEFAEAFTRLDADVGQHHWKMLRALYQAPEQTLSATNLAKAAGWEDYSTANLHLGTLAEKVARHLTYEPPRRDNGTPIWTLVFADGAEAAAADGTGHFRWRLRPEVAACLDQLNLGLPSGTPRGQGVGTP